MALDDVLLSDDDRDVRHLVRAIAEAEIAPRAQEVDATGLFPHHAMKKLAETGLLGILIPPEFGGSGGSKLQYVLAVEEVAKACAATALTYMTQAHGAVPILIAGTEAQKLRWLPRIVAGDSLAAIALTEPHAGSDLASIALRAERHGSDYHLSGQKIFITNGGVADLMTVLVRTSEGRGGLTALEIDGRPVGLVAGSPLKKMGVRGSNTVELFFDDVVVPGDGLLGGEGQGFRIALETLDLARLSTAAQALGIADRALRTAVAYARQRRQFGQTIGRFQAVQFKLVDMHARVATARQLLYSVARWADTGEPFGSDAALAKVVCSDTAMAVTTEAVQIHGGYGYIEEYEVERLMRDAKVTQIYDGTNEINRLVIARALLVEG